MLYVECTNGQIESKGEQLQEVERIEPSQSRLRILKARNINVNILAYVSSKFGILRYLRGNAHRLIDIYK